MVRIRKKTSNRMTTAHRAKIKNKARETKKKNRKAAKKNPNLHKKKKKDPGIPNSFPFKEQILAEVAESRRLAIEEKRRKEVLNRPKSSTNGEPSTSGTAITAPITVTSGRGQAAMELDVPLLIDTGAPHTAAALDTADIILHILDSRDPLSFRSAFIEESVRDKPLLYILNKIDLAPREAISAWAKTLREHHPTLFFRSATSNLPAEDAQRVHTLSNTSTNGKSKFKPSDNDSVGRDVVLDALNTIASKLEMSELNVAIVGVTNVGKSAFINSLLKNSTLTVYNPAAPRDRDGSAPTTTPYPQCVTLSHKKKSFKLIDTPGLSFIPPSLSEAMEDAETRIARDVLLRNRGNISKIHDPLPAALYILSRAVMEDLLILYNLPAVQTGDYDSFLSSLARKEGALQKRGAVVDFQGAAKALVRDWKTGRFAHYAMPPSQSDAKPSPSKTRFDLSSIYQKSDEKLLSHVLPRRDLRKQKGALVQLKDAIIDARKVDLEAVQMIEEDDEEDEDDEDDNEGEEMDEDEGEEDDDEDDEEEEIEGSDQEGQDTSEDSDASEDSDESAIQPPIAPPPSGKKRRETTRPEQGKKVGKSTTKAETQKRVSFAPYTKAGAKTKAATAKVETKKPVRTSNMPAISRKKGGGDDEDAYDFSKYF